MESKIQGNIVLLELTKEEAIVLSDWLFRFNKIEQSDVFEDQAEEKILWNIEASLEKIIPELLDKNYKELLAKAREKVR